MTATEAAPTPPPPIFAASTTGDYELVQAELSKDASVATLLTDGGRSALSLAAAVGEHVRLGAREVAIVEHRRVAPDGTRRRRADRDDLADRGARVLGVGVERVEVEDDAQRRGRLL